MALKRSKPRAEDSQLDLFAYGTSNTNHTDPIRNDGREALAGVSSDPRARIGAEGETSGDAAGRGGEDEGRDVRNHHAIDEAGFDTTASARPGLGNGEGALSSPAARNGSPVGHRSLVNYRITAADRLGEGSLKQKAQNNLAAIRLLRELREKQLPATPEEQAVLIKYVGWGGIPQIFLPNGDWRQEHEELVSLLSDEEFRLARASTLNAHYTSPAVIQGMYAALQRLGFESGRILEPACGIGHFIGAMPDAMHARSNVTCIELDLISARIALALYPNAEIRCQGFEDAILPVESFDVAVSNVPVGDYKPFDPKFNSHGFAIHDYFFVAALERVRPGGLVAFITSKGTMDKLDSTARDYLSERANLLGAIRLPNDAFKRNANTEVTADIVFLKRLTNGERPRGLAWKRVVPITNSVGEVIQVNEYFAERPHMMLGEMRLEGRMYQRNEPTLVGDGRSIAEALAEAIQHLPANVYRQPKHEIRATHQEPIIPATGDVKPNAYTLLEGEVAVREGDQLKPLPHLPLATRLRIRGMIQVRDALRDCLRTQLEDRDEGDIELARARLNQTYDRFVAHHGPISERANARAFQGDPDLPLLLSLEHYDSETKRATKTAVFRERTVQRQKPVESVDSPKSALLVSLNEKGRVDLQHMSRLLRQTPEDFLPELKGAIFFNPESQEWETEDQYLSGNVREKLRAAEAASIKEPQYHENVEALRAVQPEDLQANEIDARLGACWVPVGDVEMFVQQLLDSNDVTVRFLPQPGNWSVNAGYSAKTSVNNTTEWGTDRATALELIEDALNLRTPTIYDKVRNGTSEKLVVNAAATEAAREKQQKIKDRFKEWIWQEDERRERLTQKYNQEFNCVRLRVFNGEHLTLPGASHAITLHAHQKAGVWRILQTPNTLLGHVVGAGKTYTMVAAAKELKRLGLARKPMFVVPNHMLGQFSAELLTLYPGANILAATREDFEKHKRRELMSRIATGNWDAIIVTHAGFEKIPMSDDTRHDFFRKQIDELEEAILEEKEAHQNRRIVKELERAKKKLETRLKLLAAEEKKDNTLTFEELGVDRLFVDEAHYFKNLFYVSKMTRIAGLPQTASERAFDMFLKVQYVQETNGGGGVVFATGTPIANSVAEMFTMQRYLQMGTLRIQGLHHFDSWAATFGEPVTAMELSPDGGGYRLNTRFARFINVPELMQVFCQVADIQTADMLKLPVPGIDTGKPIVIRAPSTPELKELVADLVARADAIRNGRVPPEQDNMLKITSEGRKAALDLRVLDSSAPDHPDSKINLAADKIFEIWKNTADRKAAQLVFCDLSTPTKLRRFSVYDDLKAKLVKAGIPAEQIAFVQNYDTDAQKHALFKDVRAGKIRVLLGSTQKMGAGTNVQERLIALHHLDAPWRPADVEQREGRILRQGNNNPVVQIYRYVTEGSFDAYMWQTLETKARFIHQVMTGDTHIRHIEDVDARALTYAEVKAIASGNPLVIEKATVDAELTRLTRLRSQHADEQYRIRSGVRRLKEEMPVIARRIENLKADLAIRRDTRGDAFEIEIENQIYRDRSLAGEVLNKLATQVAGRLAEKEVGSFAGFKVVISPAFLQRVEILLRGHNAYQANVSESGLGTIRSVEYVVQTLDERLEKNQRALTDSEKRCRELESRIGLPFEHERRLESLLQRQQELESALDITKIQPANTLDSANPSEDVSEPPSQRESQNTDSKFKSTRRHLAASV
ncbi:MAG: hypothetical protein ABS95_03155 [Verrucomicrobia bacterium SCN 57-15]|nr:MAG: hypothetical protein ABS95_03155 [Verrucomicrobia bacterium SCN 57-15]